jgi:hypothetical protein
MGPTMFQCPILFKVSDLKKTFEKNAFFGLSTNPLSVCWNSPWKTGSVVFVIWIFVIFHQEGLITTKVVATENKSILDEIFLCIGFCLPEMIHLRQMNFKMNFFGWNFQIKLTF